MYLEGHIIMNAKLLLKTGLRVGAGQEASEIGGHDNPIIKNPLDGKPYIPGSSIKGKIRSLMEWELGKVDDKGKACSCAKTDCPICRIFGIGGYKVNMDLGPTRVIFRDCHFTPEFNSIFDGMIDETGIPPLETKRENVINRRRGAATLPRVMERIPAGAEFDFEMNYRVFATEEDGARFDISLYLELIKGLEYLEEDSLGGSGSRGYGRIKLNDITLRFDLRNPDYYTAEIEKINNLVKELFG